MTLEQAVDVFGVGFTYTRSFTYPFEYALLGPLRVMRDAPPRKSNGRSSEVISVGVSPDDTVQALRDYPPGRFFLSVLHGPEESEKELIAAYKAHGFRLLRREPMMIRPTSGAPAANCRYRIGRVLGQEEADRIADANRTRQILPTTSTSPLPCGSMRLGMATGPWAGCAASKRRTMRRGCPTCT